MITIYEKDDNFYVPTMMKCSKEEFNEIKDILIDHNYSIQHLTNFKNFSYLVNNFKGNKNIISNTTQTDKLRHNRAFYPKYNKQIFLSNCGILEKTIYTCEDLSSGLVACINDGSIDELRKVIKYCFSNDKAIPKGDTTFYFKSVYNANNWDASSDTILPTQSVKIFLKEIQEKEHIDFTNDYVNNLPVNFGIIIKNNSEDILLYLISLGYINKHSYRGNGINKNYYCIDKDLIIQYRGNNSTTRAIKTLTLQQFKNIMEQNTTKEKIETILEGTPFHHSDLNHLKEKEIIGYKLIRREYVSVVRAIASNNFVFVNQTILDLQDYPKEIENLKKSGVLDIWFEPIFKDEDIIFNMGNFNLKINKEGIYHNNSKITNYVRELYDTLNKIPKILNNYSFKINFDTLEFNQTGCEKHITTFRNWEKVLNIYNELQK